MNVQIREYAERSASEGVVDGGAAFAVSFCYNCMKNLKEMCNFRLSKINGFWTVQKLIQMKILWNLKVSKSSI